MGELMVRGTHLRQCCFSHMPLLPRESRMPLNLKVIKRILAQKAGVNSLPSWGAWPLRQERRN